MSDYSPHDLHPGLLALDLSETGYLPSQLSADNMAMLKEINFITASQGRHASIDSSMMAAFEENDNYEFPPALSYSSSAQSQSPPLPGTFGHSDGPSLQLQAFTDPFANTIEIEQQSPPIGPSSSKRDSDDESQRTERRRAQNRAAQRAYRQRKDQSLKQREVEVETLREELEKAQRLNRNLCKLVGLLRQRLKKENCTDTEAT